MEEIEAYREDLLSMLGGVVSTLIKAATSLPPEVWHQPVHPGLDVPHYIVFHLRALEDQVFTRQLPRILVEETPTLAVFDDHAWMAEHYRPDEAVSAIVEQIASLRGSELAWLRGLPPAGWSRLSRHPWWGIHTLQWWVELQLELSNQHLKQLPP